MQYHYVLIYNDKTNRWMIDDEPLAYFPDGTVYDPERENENNYGWFIPEEDSDEEALDFTLYRMLGYLVDTFPTPTDRG